MIYTAYIAKYFTMRFVPMSVLHEMITHFHAFDQEKKIKLLSVFSPLYKSYEFDTFPEKLYICILRRLVSTFGLDKDLFSINQGELKNILDIIYQMVISCFYDLDQLDFIKLVNEHAPDIHEDEILRFYHYTLAEIKEILPIIDGTRMASMFVSVLNDINEFFKDLSSELGQPIMQSILDHHVTESQSLEILSGMFDKFSIDNQIYMIIRYDVDDSRPDYQFLCMLARLEILGQMQLVHDKKYNYSFYDYNTILKTAKEVLSSISLDMSDEILMKCLQFLLSSEYNLYISFRTHYDMAEFFAFQPFNTGKYFQKSCFSNNKDYMWFKLNIKNHFENGTSPMTIIQRLNKFMKSKLFEKRITSNAKFCTMYNTVKNNEENRVAFVSSMKKEIETHGTITMPYIYRHIQDML